MDYVIVKCNEDREVFVDNQKNGRTSDTLRISAGLHTFELGGEQNYTPTEITKTVADTSIIEPLVIQFEV